MKRNNSNRLIALVALMLLFSSLFPMRALANSAEPPAIVVVVENAPDDLVLEGEVDGAFLPMRKSSVAWESYYKLHYSDYPSSETRNSPKAIRVTSGGVSTLLPLSDMGRGYNTVYTLNYKTMTLMGGTLPLRDTLLVAMRVVLTLVLEGLVFYLFGFRVRRSWVAFFVINLITQGGLNLLLAGSSITSGYALMGLILIEILIFLVEIPAFLIAVKEKKWWVRLLYALLANALSLILGGVLITALPV